jgi:hypothetical protein
MPEDRLVKDTADCETGKGKMGKKEEKQRITPKRAEKWPSAEDQPFAE